MKRHLIIGAAIVAVCGACSERDENPTATATATETVGAAGGGAGAGAAAPGATSTVAVPVPGATVTTTATPRGDSVRIGPDGAEVNIDDGDASVRVGPSPGVTATVRP